MSRARQRADRIREQIPITRVLVEYGYPVHDGYSNEEQFSCDLHGDGHDNIPSARVYPDSNSWYCFACDQTRDSIQTVREKEGMDFWPAVKLLEKRYGLKAMSYTEDADFERPPAEGLSKAVSEAVTVDRTIEEAQRRTHKLLDGLTTDRDVPLTVLLGAWEGYDKVCYLVRKERVSEATAREALATIRTRVLEKLREANDS